MLNGSLSLFRSAGSRSAWPPKQGLGLFGGLGSSSLKASYFLKKRSVGLYCVVLVKQNEKAGHFLWSLRGLEYET